MTGCFVFRCVLFLSVLFAGLGDSPSLAAAGSAGSAILPDPRLPSTEVLPPGIFRPLQSRPGLQRAFSARHPGYLQFLSEHPGRWRAEWNEGTGTPHRIYGDALDLGDGNLPGGPGGGMEEAARGLIASYPDLFPVSPDSLELEVDKDLESFRVLRFRQVHRGIPVLGARVEVWVTPRGRAILLGCDVLPGDRLPSPVPEPMVGAGEALTSARSHAGDGGFVEETTLTRLIFVPFPAEGRLWARLAWEVRATSAGSGSQWIYLIAADDGPVPGKGGAGAVGASGRAPGMPAGSGPRAGDVLGRWDQISQGSVTGKVRGKGSPGLFPDVPWNPPEFMPIPGLRVMAGGHSAIAGAEGDFEILYSGGGTVIVTASLEGPSCSVQNFAGANLVYFGQIASGTELAIDFNQSPAEFGTAQVNAFLSVNRAHDFVKYLDPTFTEIDRPLLTIVNFNEVCNAFFSPEGEGKLVFFQSSPCVNSAYSTVVYHEYSHFLLWKAFGSAVPMPGYNEGFADVFAAFLTDQPVIGHAFNGIPGVNGLPIRDLSGPSLRYPDDLLRDPHDSGLIFGGALWDLRGALGESLGPPAGLDLARSLWIRSLFLAPSLISPDLTLDFLALDDDDGLLSNGTPHFEEIAGAFGRRGLPPPGRLVITHSPLRDTVFRGPFTVEAMVRSEFDFLHPDIVTLHYSIDGGFRYVSQDMAAADGARFVAKIPEQIPGTTVRYFIDAWGAGGIHASLPEGAPEEETIAFTVGGAEIVFADGFDGGESGWSHGTVPNGHPENEDDWERGAPKAGVPSPEEAIDGNLLDPPAAFSPPNCWGNDLALSGRTDGNHSPLSKNYLLSLPIDCRGKFGLHLRFRRWLTVERFDRAKVSVDGVDLYSSPSDRDTIDTSWRAMDYDIASLADDREGVRIRFELASNIYIDGGGWNIDDVAVVATGSPTSPRPKLLDIDPSFDFKGGGAKFTLQGSGFTAVQDTRLFFGQSPVTEFSIVDSETIQGTVPPSAPGLQVISLENGGGAAALPGRFTYFDLPSLDSLIPDAGRLPGGDFITLHGDYFTPGTEVLIGGKPLTEVNRFGRDVIVGTLPAGDDIGPADLVIRGSYGESRFPGAFTYYEPPALLDVEPSFGPLSGGIPFTLRGEYFPDQISDIAIDFGSRRILGFTVASRTEIRGVVPSGDREGPILVRITTPGGAAVIPGGFYYFVKKPPVFIRGDLNLDGFLDITDGIAILGFLFQGGKKPPCLDAADTTDDGELDVSDAVAVLFFLFTGGAQPPRPFLSPGPDVTADNLGCETGL